MRKDMAKVVTERPRRGHYTGLHERNQWTATRGKVRNAERDDDDLPTSVVTSKVSTGRKKDYDDSTYGKQFSDLLGPLRGYLRKQVGRPWDKVWSELSANLDKRSITGSHIFDHIEREIETKTYLAADGKTVCTLPRYRWLAKGEDFPVMGLYVHPRTGLICYAKQRTNRMKLSWRKNAESLRGLGLVTYETRDDDYARWRVESRDQDTARVWERREHGWFILDYKRTPEWRESVPYEPSRYEKGKGHPEFRLKVHQEAWVVVSVKQASKREMAAVRQLLATDPLGGKW